MRPVATLATARDPRKELMQMKAIGLLLLVVGLVALVFGGIDYSRQRTLLAVGPIKATTTEHKFVPLTPVVGSIVLLGGIALLVVPRRRFALSR